MVNFIIRRVLIGFVVLWIVFTISFFLMRSVPGGPFSGERNLAPEIKEAIEEKYQLDLPLSEQYFNNLIDACRLDFGVSFKISDYKVNQIILEGLPHSISLGVLALAFALTLGLTAGICSAVFRGGLLDMGLMTMATLGIALPNFVIAGIMITIFVFTIPLLPAAGWGQAKHMVLPAFCLGLPYAAYIARIIRTSMLDVLSHDYIRTARAKGLSTRKVILGHALPGALLPIVSFLGPATAGILTGSMVVEQIFAIPGIGSQFIQAALDGDYTLAMGMVLLYTVLLYSMNLIVDVSYAFLDPRIKLE